MKGCPDKKYISAYLDGELDKDSYEAIHIAKCQKCRAELFEYAALSKSLKKHIASSLPPNLTDRIKFGVRKRLNPGKSYSVSVPVFIFRMAAGFMFFLGVLAVSLSYFRGNTPASPETNTLKQNPVIASKNSNTGALKLEDLYKVNYKGLPVNLEMDNFVRQNAAADDTVTEMWTVKDFNSVYNLISMFNYSGKLQIEVRKISGPDEKLRIIFKSTEENIITFTKLCSDAGFINKLTVNLPVAENIIQGKKQDIILKADFALDKN